MPVNIKIYSAHHTRPLFKACHNTFIPFWAGGSASSSHAYVVDSEVPRKPTLGYNEMSVQYYVWKHLLNSVDYVGFEHYRRLILFPQIFDHLDAGLINLAAGQWHCFADDESYANLLRRREEISSDKIHDLQNFIAQYDIILPIAYESETLVQQWARCQYDLTVLDQVKSCIRCSDAFMTEPYAIDFATSKTFFCNIFVSKVHIFREYMRFWEQVMFALQGTIDFSSRMPAFISERLFSVFINHKITTDKLRFVEIPFTLCLARKVPQESD